MTCGTLGHKLVVIGDPSSAPDLHRSRGGGCKVTRGSRWSAANKSPVETQTQVPGGNRIRFDSGAGDRRFMVAAPALPVVVISVGSAGWRRGEH